MKVIILAGGFGTRLSEYTDRIPKLIVNIAGEPILCHLMQRYLGFGHKDFYLALGYKAEVIKEYFLNIAKIDSNSSKESAIHVQVNESSDLKWQVTLVDTGQDSMTGGRVKRMQKFIGNEPFMLTYGDGLADIDINKLVSFHKNHGKMVTITAVRPVARFGELTIVGNNACLWIKDDQNMHRHEHHLLATLLHQYMQKLQDLSHTTCTKLAQNLLTHASI